MRFFSRAAFATSFLCACFVSHAGPISPEQFAKHAEISEVSISPTGEYVAIVVPTENGLESQLQLIKLDGTSNQAIRLGTNQHLTDIVWSDNHRVVVSKATKEFGEERPRATGELMAVDVDAKNQQLLFGYVADQGNSRGRRKDQGFAWVAHVMEKEPGSVLIGYNSWTQGEEPDTVFFRVDTHTGGRKEVERVKRAANWVFDREGRLRVLVTLDAMDKPVMYYRPTPASPLLPMPASLVGYRAYSGYFGEDGNTAFTLISDAGEPAQLYRIDMAKGTREKVAGNPDQEIAYAQIGGNNGTPFAVAFNSGKPSIVYIDTQSEWTKLHAGLMKHFAGQLVTFVNFTKDNHSVLFSVHSDRNPASYYLYDVPNKKLRLVSESQPWMKPEQLTPMTAVEFKAEDGTKLYGFYTANGSGPKPLVVIPHGGPFGPYDRWSYDADAQFLASRGYGVLQVNFRGSGGRGQNFEESGWKHWGDKIQDDLADGVRWAVKSGLADGNRVCIFGASFGGYSALMSPIRHPGLYKCAIGYAGVYDLNLLRKTDNAARSKAGRRFLDREVGVDEALLAQTSPAQHSAKLNIPVFLVHGRNDETAKLDQYRAMEAALKRAGSPYETMLIDSEGHGFYNPKNIAELYRRMEAFLAKHIGSAVAPVSATPAK